ncbi:MAG: PilZ domain-containing protein [Pseudomonadota bacterium]
MSAMRSDTHSLESNIRSARDRRRNKRVDLEIEGRFLSDSGDDHTLRTRNLSCSGALVHAAQQPPEGSDLICYFDEFGRVATTVIRHTPDGFAIAFKVSPHKKDKLADRLTWLLNREELDLSEDREAPRHVASGPAMVTRADGRQIQCTVVDISLTGASFEASGPAPFVGEIVKTGNLSGEVVRRHRNAFAVRFLRGAEAPAAD